MQVGGPSGRLDFFVSHAGPDEDWAVWLAQQLQSAGFTVELDVWNWTAGTDVIQVTQRALDRARRVLAVWTPDYFTRRWADMEHRVSFARSQAQPGWLVPVVVRDCPEEAIPVLYRTLIRIELVGLTEAQARERLLAAVTGPKWPTTRLPYPGEGEQGSYPGRLPPLWNVPSRNLFFTGRETELAELADRLAEPGSAAAVVGATTAGGLGRSELVAEFAWRQASNLGRLVWWIDAGHQASAEASLIELAALMGIPTASGLAAVMPVLRAQLDQHTDWLLIVDNVPDRPQLDQLLPTRAGRLLVTSRDPDVLAENPPVIVGRFSRTESVTLLRRRCSWLSQQAGDRIAGVVEDLPVAVAQAAQFLARTGMAADEYLPRLANQVGSAPEDLAEADVGLAATVAVGQERLLASDPAAADLLDQFALLAAEPIPLTAASDGEPVPGLVVSDPETTGELVSSICGLGLAVTVGTHVQLQARVHALIAGSMAQQRQVLALGRVLRLLATADPGDPGAPANWPLYASLAPHVQAATRWLDGTVGVTETVRFQRLLEHVCQYLQIAGRAQDSYRLADAAYLRRQRTHGDDDPETLRWSVNRGVALGALGNHDESRQVLTQALERQQRIVGANHPETLSTANQLGVTLLALGEYEAAVVILRETLLHRRERLGDDAPETLQSAADLGRALSSLGYHAPAREVLEEVTSTSHRVLGVDHIDTVASAHELGVVLASLGDHGAARGVLTEVLAARRASLGLSHVDTLVSAHELGVVLAALGDHDAARDVLGDTVARRRVVLGAEHQDTLASAHAFGVTLATLGEHREARATLADVVAGRRTALGDDHVDTLATAHELGVVLAALGDRDTARAVLADTARLRRTRLGSNHPDTLHTEGTLRWL